MWTIFHSETRSTRTINNSGKQFVGVNSILRVIDKTIRSFHVISKGTPEINYMALKCHVHDGIILILRYLQILKNEFFHFVFTTRIKFKVFSEFYFLNIFSEIRYWSLEYSCSRRNNIIKKSIYGIYIRFVIHAMNKCPCRTVVRFK